MAPQDDSFSIGDTVMVMDMPEDSGLNGVTAMLLKPLGKGRWSIKVEGDEKSRVVATTHLKKFAMKGGAKYLIVGTWDDWEPREMSWNEDLGGYEFMATIGADGSESFKILKNGDWDGCIYPSCKDANPWVSHKILGPDDGGMNEEWTIGAHVKDKVTVGAVYKITLLVDGGTPLSVGWEKQQERQERQTKQAPPVESAEPAPRPPVPSRKEEEAAQLPARFSERLRQGQDITWNDVADHGARKMEQDDVEERERQARERLAARFAAAEKVEPLAIEYEADNWSAEIEARQNVNRQTQVEINRERYRKSVDFAIHGPRLAEVEKEREAMQTAVRPCVECGKMAAAFVGNGVCEPCWKAWQDVQKMIDNPPDVIPDNLPAGLRIMLRMKRSQLNTATAAVDEYVPPVMNEDRRTYAMMHTDLLDA
mmetsp:Transcript_52517/g.163068  ORF Transcript_52517/g.163068 Transcript_52517/m.163068 type:complete len:424 (+) Transcript_52517:57-1328(+)|eukprot:CAMPEP_0204563212 /NCGR_PEP_ID=MMETSP0661-20131031/34179_1 /ASSEMBLY_ACC=CAM_ASM_000606 /TAXON_ID=109239 /ORGANISM="Alexandrium margalefi, Strain AMGDE01CS-322" /LENGTH=423 /DNA_ID=CAMNT_0051570749 /DNA_START=51 /DNA_END=1322 /DNA_ORIENTATION=+